MIPSQTHKKDETDAGTKTKSSSHACRRRRKESKNSRIGKSGRFIKSMANGVVSGLGSL